MLKQSPASEPEAERDRLSGQDRVSFIRNTSLFGGLGEDEAQQLTALMSENIVAPGQVLFNENERGDRFYIIVDGSVDVAARFIPARTVGGDLYDFIPLGRGRLGIAIGDVSDKGVPAAIFMALTSSILRAEATRSASPRRVLERVNHLLLGMNEAGMFVTLLYGILDSVAGLFAYARAGHELPLLLARDDRPVSAPLGRSTPLALFEDPVLDEQALPLVAGSSMLLKTDGVTDITDAQGERFGSDRLLQAAGEVARVEASQAMCDALWTRLEEYQGGAVQADDVALVVVRNLGVPGGLRAADPVH